MVTFTAILKWIIALIVCVLVIFFAIKYVWPWAREYFAHLGERELGELGKQVPALILLMPTKSRKL